MHLVSAVSTQLVWGETTCSLAPDEDGDFVASYTVDRVKHSFFAGGKTRPEQMPCWVPVPSVLENVGSLEKPARATVPLRDKLSFGWIVTAVIGLLAGLTTFVVNFLDERRRRNREIEPDVFDTSD